jgi:uncharacterized protein YndB with AHSA1/START domain
MARSELVIAAPPEAVWDVLAEPRHYAHWVVGSSEIRGWDEEWPEPGSRFYHRVGVSPLRLADHTEAVDAEPPGRLVLKAKARPVGAARVEMIMRPHPAGTLVTMIEDPAVPLPRILVPPPIHALLRIRNGESLRRLRAIAETGRKAPASSDATPAKPRVGPGRRRRKHSVVES